MNAFIRNYWPKILLAGAMLFVTCGIIFSPHLPFSDNPTIQKAVEFAIHGMITLFALALLLFALGRYQLMFVAMGCVGALCVFLKSESNNHLILPKNELAPKLSIAHFNLSSVNDSREEFLEYVVDLDADVLSFQELTPDWNIFLTEGLKEKYKNSQRNVRIDFFGKALFTRNTIVDKNILEIEGIPSLMLSIKIGSQIVNLISLYCLPLDEKSKQVSLEQLKVITQEITTSRFPTILLGDLNMVYWSNEIRAFRKNAKLENSRRGFSPLGFKVPHDHMFFSRELECSNFENLTDPKSNHLGLFGSFQFKNLPSEEEIRASVGSLGSK